MEIVKIFALAAVSDGNPLIVFSTSPIELEQLKDTRIVEPNEDLDITYGSNIQEIFISMEQFFELQRSHSIFDGELLIENRFYICSSHECN